MLLSQRKYRLILLFALGAEGRNRTGMGLSPVDFESTASTYFTTSAYCELYLNLTNDCQAYFAFLTGQYQGC